MRYVLVLLLFIGSGLVPGGPFTTDVTAQAEVPPVLWGVDEDDNQLFSIADYTQISNGAAAAGFINHGRLKYNRGTENAPNIVDLPLVSSPGTNIPTGGHIGSIALDTQGIGFMALNAGLEFDDPTVNLAAPVLLRFDTANATPVGTLDVVDIIGQINIPGFDEPVNADNISGLSFDPVSGNLYALYRVGSKQFNPGNDRLLIVSPADATMDPVFGLKEMTGIGHVVLDGEDLEFDEFGNLYATDDQDDHLYRIDKSTGAIVELVDNNEAGGLGAGPTKIEALAWDPELNQMVASATLRQLFYIQTLQNGNNTPLGGLTGLTDVEAIDFVIPVADNPAIDIRKQEEGPDSRTLPAGSPVTFNIVVTNTGEVALTSVTVTDEVTPECANTEIPDLAVGDVFTYECTTTSPVVTGFLNEACVSATIDDETVGNCDTSAVEIPGINIEKWTKIVAPSAGDFCGTFGKHQQLTMRYTGDNIVDHSQKPGRVNVTGDPGLAPLVHIIAADNASATGNLYFDGDVNLGDEFVIDGTQAMTGSDTFVLIFEQKNNPVQTIKFNTSCYQPLNLGDQFGGIQLIDFADDPAPDYGVDADTPDGPEGRVGDDVIWTYFVTGSAPLGNIFVVDDNGTPSDTSDDFNPTFVSGDDNDDNVLNIDETWLFQAMGQVKLGQYANIGHVTGVDLDDTTLMDEDPSHYIGICPAKDCGCADDCDCNCDCTDDSTKTDDSIAGDDP